MPYVVGVNPNSPSNPHSAAASGGDNITAIDTDPEQEAHVLYGAVIGGPDKQDRYFDIRSDWVETEVRRLPTLTHLDSSLTGLTDSDRLQRPDAHARRDARRERHYRSLLHEFAKWRLRFCQTNWKSLRCRDTLREKESSFDRCQGRNRCLHFPGWPGYHWHGSVLVHICDEKSQDEQGFVMTDIFGHISFVGVQPR